MKNLDREHFLRIYVYTEATARQFKGCEWIGLWELEKTERWQSSTRGTNVKQVDDMWDK